MKKTFAVTAMLLLLTATMATASETAWRINIRADNGSGGYYGYYAQIGVATNGTDGVDQLDIPCNWAGDMYPQQNAHVVSVIPTDAVKTYMTGIQQGIPPTYPNVWDVRVGAAKNAPYTTMRVYFTTTSTPAVMPPLTTADGTPLAFKLKMINNRGVAGAPANGTEWDVPIPTAEVITAPGFFSLTLPVLKLSSEVGDATMRSEGYQFEFRQEVVPEPSGLLTLSTSLFSLVGLVTRRRKA